MKLKFLKSDLLKGVQISQDVISQRAALPILSNFLIEAEKNTVKITATDLNVGIITKIPASIMTEGAVTIPAKKFSDIIKELPEGEVILDVRKNNQVVIEAKPCFFKIMGLPKDEFPTPPQISKSERLLVGQEMLKNMLKLTYFSVSRDETRYMLNGILFKVAGDFLELAATDGRRLAVVKNKTDIPKGMIKEVIIPIKTINELNKLLVEQGQVEILFGENQVCFNLENIKIISRVIEGEFPKYTQVIPAEVNEKVKIGKDRLMEAIRRINLLTSQDSPSVKLELFKDKLVVSKNTPEVGQGYDIVELAEQYEGKEISIGFNPNYLTDVLKSISDETVNLELISSEKPGVIRMGSNYVYVVLPMQAV